MGKGPADARILLRIGTIFILLLVGGCGVFADSDQLSRCRAIIGMLQPHGTRIDITGRSVEPGQISIRYTTGEVGGLINHLVSCRFGDFESGRHRLVEAVSTERGALGEAQLFFLNSFAFNDPDFFALSPPLTQSELSGLPHLSPGMGEAVQQLVSQAPIPVIYGLLAAAYALIYGIIGRINLAFGPFISLGGMAAGIGYLIVITTDGKALLPAIATAFVMAIAVSAVWGEFISNRIFEPMMARSGQHVLVASAGLLIAMQEFLRLTQGERSIWLPSMTGGAVPIAVTDNFVVTMTPSVMLVTLAGLIPCLLLLAFLRWSAFGRRWRAVADDPLAAQLFGVSPRRTLALSFTIAGAMTGLCGFLIAVHYGGISFSEGFPFAFKALAGAVIGGIGSVGGAMLGGILLGFAEGLWSSTMAIADREIAIFAMMVLFLTLWPNGIFGYRDEKPRAV